VSNDIEIQGFSALQRELADRIWSLDTQGQVEEFVGTLPKSLRREAWVVMQMIIAAELDTYMEVTDEVHSYLSSR
jgi:hypothetical protein